MMRSRKVFSLVVGKIFFSASPMDVELALAFAIFEPVESHVNGLGTALFDGVVGDAGSTTVVNLNGSGWLWMAHFVQNYSDHDPLFRVEKTGAQFGFGGGCENHLHDGA
jgi:hypothetical protein